MNDYIPGTATIITSTACWENYRTTMSALIRATTLWHERLYQHANGNDATAPWES